MKCPILAVFPVSLEKLKLEGYIGTGGQLPGFLQPLFDPNLFSHPISLASYRMLKMLRGRAIAEFPFHSLFLVNYAHSVDKQHCIKN